VKVEKVNSRNDLKDFEGAEVQAIKNFFLNK
jgi:hypothetical protein